MKIKPLSNRVLLKALESEQKTASGIILPESAQEKKQEAEVIAVGKGKMVHGEFVEPSVKVGDIVIYSKYSGDEIKLDGKEYTLIEEDKILAIVEK